jgi:hypothetical protein
MSRKNPGHWTTKPDHVATVIRATGKAEKKFNDGLWRKVYNGQIFEAPSRDAVRRKVKTAKSC